jgi:hypothetical protein
MHTAARTNVGGGVVGVRKTSFPPHLKQNNLSSASEGLSTKKPHYLIKPNAQ